MASAPSLSVSCASSEGVSRREVMGRETKASNLEFIANKLATRLPRRNLAIHGGANSCEHLRFSVRDFKVTSAQIVRIGKSRRLKREKNQSCKSSRFADSDEDR